MRTWLLAALLYLNLAAAGAAGPDTGSAAALGAKYVELGPQLRNSPFMRPLVLTSSESSGQVKGDIYARLVYPFATVRTALGEPGHWCDVMILHLNTKYCRALGTAASTTLQVGIGRKDFQPIEQAYRLDFLYRAATPTPTYFDIGLSADAGPLGTSDYRLRLEALALADDTTFLHLSYSYAYDFSGWLAMQGYLAAAGRGKVGFTHAEPKPGLPSSPIGGVRGAVERNTMRYYLAIDAYLGALSVAPAEQLEKRLQNWFNATERYARQLHELERGAYLEMKRSEYLRQQKPL